MLLISIIIETIDILLQIRIITRMGQPSEPTLAIITAKFLDMVKLARSSNTARTYHNAVSLFMRVLEEHGKAAERLPITELREDAIGWMADHLKTYSPATEQVYLQAITGLYQYLAAERLSEVNLARVRLLLKQRARRPGIRLPQFPADDIQQV